MAKRKFQVHLPPPGRTIRSELLGEIEHFRHKHGMPQTKFGFLALGDGNFLERFKKGRDLHLGTVEVVRDFMRDYEAEQKTSRDGMVNNRAA